VLFLPKLGTLVGMLDHFDLALLNLVQRDDSRTAESLGGDVPLSPSAIARRLRRLRSDGWIARTIALLTPKLTSRRLRALVLVQLAEHADQRGKQALLDRIEQTPQVQFCYEIAGAHDLVLLFDCLHMDEFTETAEAVLVADPTVRRYETSFVKRQRKFAPFVELRDVSPALN
jgi:Lrp/AsnC family transcriptional regulator, leucine-responsive regulatory protein